MRARNAVVLAFLLASADVWRPLAAQEPTPRNQLTLNASVLAGGLTYARTTRSTSPRRGRRLGFEFNIRLVVGEKASGGSLLGIFWPNVRSLRHAIHRAPTLLVLRRWTSYAPVAAHQISLLTVSRLFDPRLRASFSISHFHLPQRRSSVSDVRSADATVSRIETSNLGRSRMFDRAHCLTNAAPDGRSVNARCVRLFCTRPQVSAASGDHNHHLHMASSPELLRAALEERIRMGPETRRPVMKRLARRARGSDEQGRLEALPKWTRLSSSRRTWLENMRRGTRTQADGIAELRRRFPWLDGLDEEGATRARRLGHYGFFSRLCDFRGDPGAETWAQALSPGSSVRPPRPPHSA